MTQRSDISSDGSVGTGTGAVANKLVGVNDWNSDVNVDGAAKRARDENAVTTVDSDDRLRETIANQFASSELGSVQVKVWNGEITLAGKVSSVELKLQAETIAHTASGVTGVTNRLEVD